MDLLINTILECFLNEIFSIASHSTFMIIKGYRLDNVNNLTINVTHQWKNLVNCNSDPSYDFEFYAPKRLTNDINSREIESKMAYCIKKILKANAQDFYKKQAALRLELISRQQKDLRRESLEDIDIFRNINNIQRLFFIF